MGVKNCADDYDPSWSGYYDGYSGGVYFCYDFNLDQYQIGERVEFKIEHKACPNGGGNSWVVSLGATFPPVNCLWQPSNFAIGLHIGLEVVSSPDNLNDRNIDVKFTQLQKKTAAGWSSLGTPTQYNISFDYSTQYINSQTQNFYLAPLN